MEPKAANAIVNGLAGAIKNLQLYPVRHPAIERQVNTLKNHLIPQLDQVEALRLGLLDNTLFLDDYLFSDGFPAAEEMAGILRKFDLEGVEFVPGISPGELLSFLHLIHTGKGKGPAFEKLLLEQEIRHIQVIFHKEEEETPREIYNRALQVVESMFRDVRLGKIPSCAEASQVVRKMVETTLEEPQALFALSMLKDYDKYTFTHSVNVSVIALAAGRACKLSPAQLRVLGLGALLHDIGKLKIAHDIINKPGLLTREEYEEIKKHPHAGAELVAQMEGVSAEVVDIVLGHHLRFDRRGYPSEAFTREISPMADLAAIADAYDAMTTLRSYHRPLTPRKAISELQKHSGTKLHPGFLDPFITSLGPYPVGSLIRMDSGEVCLVTWTDPGETEDLRIKVLFDSEGTRLSDPPRLEMKGMDLRRIVAEVDPALKGIEVTEFLEVE